MKFSVDRTHDVVHSASRTVLAYQRFVEIVRLHVAGRPIREILQRFRPVGQIHVLLEAQMRNRRNRLEVFAVEMRDIAGEKGKRQT